MFQLTCFLLVIATALGGIVHDAPTAIINGNLANVEDYPYYAFLGSSEGLYCGGAFIAPDLVLTAAHCLENDFFKVYTGITTLEDLKTAEAYDLKTMKSHPDYHGQSSFDIGLIKLTKNITLGDKAQLIEPATENPPIDEEGTVVGFGVVQCDNFLCWSPGSKHLRSANVRFLRIDDEGAIYTESEDGKNTCHGDSGGPIVYDDRVVGLVSSGQFVDCIGHDTQAPVAPFIDWIEKTAETL